MTIEGYWYRTILWEVPLMALISELYFIMTGEPINSRRERLDRNLAKGKEFYAHGLSVADFGTRRRYSYDNQFEVVGDLLSCFSNGKPFLVGTSNVHIAMKKGYFTNRNTCSRMGQRSSSFKGLYIRQQTYDG